MSSHHRATITFLCLALTLTLPPSTAWSQASMHALSESSIHLQIGDSVRSVQQALGGDDPIAGEMRLPDRGIWVFFNGLGQARQYRFDAPFSGGIHGAKIGASSEQVQELLGTPGRELPGWSESRRYKAYLIASMRKRRFAAISRWIDWRRFEC
jgi:hypothetical protein